MLESLHAQMRLAASFLLERPFHLPSLNRLLDTLIATRREFGVISAEAGELLGGPILDEKSVREIQLRRFRTQAQRAARETAYYAARFAALRLDPKRLTWDELAHMPLTTKTTLCTQPEALLRHGQNPTFRATTTGTTGAAASAFFTAHELAAYTALAALSFMLQGAITEQDVVQVSTSARALLSNSVFMGACQRAGALVYQTGIIAPEEALTLLRTRRMIPGKHERPTVLMTYPSYLGKLVTLGLQQGYSPADFGVTQIILGGEIVTAALRQRCQALFGPITIQEGYGITEAWPVGGSLCEQGHLHFDPMSGLVEVIDPENGSAVQPGEIGSLVITPFAPYREAMVLLRYDTEDLVQALAAPCTCSLRHQPATGPLLGKRRFAVRHAHGWTTPRAVLQAVEAIVELPLPARCGFQPHADGVRVEVAVSTPSPRLQEQLLASLWAQQIPVRALQIKESATQLTHPLPWRSDLREQSFQATPLPSQEVANDRPISLEQYHAAA